MYVLRRCRCSYAAFLSPALAFLVLNGRTTQGAIVDRDTTIDGTNSFPGVHVSVVDGPAGPTAVRMAAGGSVGGFSVFGESSFVMEGGQATFLSGIHDGAVFIMKGGVVDCSVCAVIDYDAVFHADGASTLHLSGGSLLGPVALGGTSTAHFYGTEMQITPLPERGIIDVAGVFANGDVFFTVFRHIPDYSTRILLHEAPEPATAYLVFPIFLIGYFANGARWRKKPLTH